MVTQVLRAKPTSPGRRHVVEIKTKGLHKGKPHPALVVDKHSTGGRNNTGRITVRHRGGGHKRKLRTIDWRRDKVSVKARVERLEYDPNRTSHIALLVYTDGERRYILAPKDLKVDDVVVSGLDAPISIGNCLPFSNIPVGTIIHNIELQVGKGAQFVRSAGAQAQLLAKEGLYATVRLRSGEMRKIPLDCRAVIGEVGNGSHNLRKLGKAGAKRWRGVRPTVRGVAMNPVDHPLGGGEGRTSGGRPPCDPWGRPEGTNTRNNKRSDNLIVRKRKHASGKKGRGK